MKRLHRSKKEKMWAGVCGGIGEYADIDPSVIRIAWLFIALVTGIIPGLLFKYHGSQRTMRKLDDYSLRIKEGLIK